MPELTLKFTLPEEAFEARMAQQAMLMHSFVTDLLEHLKREDTSASDELRKWSWEWFHENNFDPYDEGGF